MSAIHPFDLYKMFISLRTHFNSIKFVYNHNIINLKYENFYRSKNHIYYEKYASKLSKEDAEKIFISNFVKNIDTSIHMITPTIRNDVTKEWINRLKTIDSLFENDVKRLFKEYKIKTTHDFYYKLTDIETINKSDNKVSSIDDITKAPTTVNHFYTDLIFNYSPEVIVVLNHLYYKKYTFDFLRECLDKKIEPKKEFIKLYKYNRFIDVESLIGNNKYEKINTFFNNM